MTSTDGKARWREALGHASLTRYGWVSIVNWAPWNRVGDWYFYQVAEGHVAAEGCYVR